MKGKEKKNVVRNAQNAEAKDLEFIEYSKCKLFYF